MAASFNGSISVVVNGTLTSDIDSGGATHKVNNTYKTTFTNGTAADQANMMFSDDRQISGSGSDDLDLAGSLTDAFGTTITFTSIKAIIIKADADNGNNLSIGGDATAPFSTLFADGSDELILAPGGTLCLVNPNANGYAVTATTADILEITNADSSAANYEITIIGEV